MKTTNQTDRAYDMIIVGGGPGGYTAALYAARAGLDTIVFERFSAGGQLALDESGYVVAGEDTKTSVLGVYAVGDIRTKLLRQVVTAVADGAMAVYAAEEYLAGND